MALFFARSETSKSGGLGGGAPNKLSARLPMVSGGRVDVACQDFTFFGLS